MLLPYLPLHGPKRQIPPGPRRGRGALQGSSAIVNLTERCVIFYAFGIADSGAGNTYIDNRCTGNASGDSSPAGLCQ
jgi:hypothetical protein